MKKLLILLLICVSLYTNAQTADSTSYKQKYKNRVNMGIGFTSLGVGLGALGMVLKEPRDKGGKQPGIFLYFGGASAAFGLYSLISAIHPYHKYRVLTGKSKKTALYFQPQNLSLTYNF
jgi:hypothetical protein